MTLRLKLVHDEECVEDIPLTNEPVYRMFVHSFLGAVRVFNEKQDERGPDNVNRMGVDGLLGSIEERVARVRAAVERDSLGEIQANIWDIAVFAIILDLYQRRVWPDSPVIQPTSVGTGPVFPEAVGLGGLAAQRLAKVERDVGDIRAAVRKLTDELKEVRNIIE